jgi:3D (Asp-Asp-Asp) domain-containing protein
MTQRQLDLALLAGIGVLLLALLVLALRVVPEDASAVAVAPRASRLERLDAPAETVGLDITEPAQVTLPEAPGEESVTSEGGQGAESAAAASQIGSEPAGGALDRSASPAGPSGAGQAAPSGAVPRAPGGAAATGGEVLSAADGIVGEAMAPQGAVESLERVGFAFGAGNVGACGVPLQPWQHVAVSRDLLERYGCGATVEITLAESVAGRERVVAQVGDTMGAELTGTVNIFVAEDEPAFEYGVTEGTLRAIGSP